MFYIWPSLYPKKDSATRCHAHNNQLALSMGRFFQCFGTQNIDKWTRRTPNRTRQHWNTTNNKFIRQTRHFVRPLSLWVVCFIFKCGHFSVMNNPGMSDTGSKWLNKQQNFKSCCVSKQATQKIENCRNAAQKNVKKCFFSVHTCTRPLGDVGSWLLFLQRLDN